MSNSVLELTPAADGGVLRAPLTSDPLSTDQAAQIAPLLKALADPVRLRLLSLVASHRGGEACVCDLTGAFDLSQPTISHHLKVLHESGLLDRSSWCLGLLPDPRRRAHGCRVPAWRAAPEGPVPASAKRPSVVFVCVHNAGRSQMAAGFLTV